MGEMVVTMQETFAGIRVIKSFAREAHQEKEFKRSNQMQFSQMMRIIRSMEATGPLVETIAALGIGLALLYVYAANLSAGRFFGLISGIFILYDPIKTLSKLQIVMQQSITATTAIFALLDTEPTVQDSPDATKLTSATGESCTVGSVTRRADRKSTRLNSSHANISYAVFCLKKKEND